MGVGEDRISDLPDSILHCILSLLSTKEAIGTSILSKRWQWLWTCVPNLDFEFSSGDGSPNPDEPRKFLKYVDGVLLHHCKSCIRKFELSCDSSCDELSVISWISIVVTQKLQELYLYACIERPHLLPLSIYTCESLTNLEISTSSNFKLPASISLPHLKSLCLICAIFPDEYTTNRLFSTSPVLEELTLYSCRWVNHKILLIPVPSLKHLNLKYPCFGEDGDKCDRAIKICSPNLEHFDCNTKILPRGYILGDMPSLEYAEIYTEEIIPVLTEEERCASVSMLFKCLHNVEVLRIAADILKVLPHEDLDDELPIFHNVIDLTVVRFCDGRDILSLLRIMPNLQSLTYDQAADVSEEDLTIDVTEAMPQCLLSSLKKVIIEEYNGYGGELFLIKFLLKNALALESMVITNGCFMTEDPCEVMEDWKRINQLPKGSSSCDIEFFENPYLDDSD